MSVPECRSAWWPAYRVQAPSRIQLFFGRSNLNTRSLARASFGRVLFRTATVSGAWISCVSRFFVSRNVRVSPATSRQKLLRPSTIVHGVRAMIFRSSSIDQFLM